MEAAVFGFNTKLEIIYKKAEKLSIFKITCSFLVAHLCSRYALYWYTVLLRTELGLYW
jgi:hypothetical protein